ncbi:hypothetical protein HQ531_14475 [bacterium]|nr:hypothetical protein [bacterium]
MSSKRTRVHVLILICFFRSIVAGEPHSNSEINDLMMKSWEQIQDYEVDIRLSLDIPGFRMPSRNIHYLFKTPDKSKVEVKGFAIVPKQGIQPFFTFLKDSVSFNIIADTIVNGKPVFEVLVEDTFMNKPGRITLFIDQMTGSIYQAQVSHEDREFFNLVSEYDVVNGITLPISTEIHMKFPPDFKNIQRLGKKPMEMKEFDDAMTDEWLEGSVQIKFENYKVNQGIPDYRFEEDDEDSIQD